MKKYFLVLAMILSTTAMAADAPAAAPVKIGVFDAQHVLDSIDEGKNAVSSLEKEALDRKKTIETKGKELEKMKQDLDSQKLVLSKDAFDKKQKDFEQKAIDFNKMQYDAQKDVLRIDVPVEKQSEATEAFSIIFEKNNGGANMVIAWDDVVTRVPFSW